jgi:hypothetical protein
MTDVCARWRIQVGVRLDEFCLQGAKVMWRDGRDTNLRVDRSGYITDPDSGLTLATIRVEHCLYGVEGTRTGSLDLCPQVEEA